MNCVTAAYLLKRFSFKERTVYTSQKDLFFAAFQKSDAAKGMEISSHIQLNDILMTFLLDSEMGLLSYSVEVDQFFYFHQE